MRPLPNNLTTRPATADDLAAVAELIATCERHDLGEAFLTADDLAAGWNRRAFEMATDTVLIQNGDTVIGWAEVLEERAEGAVHPEWRGRGIGTWLAGWTERRATDQGATSVGQTVPDMAAGASELLIGRGYEARHTSWVLSRDTGEPIRPRPLPDGVILRPFSETEERAIYQVVEDAFNEWPTRVPQTFEQWRAWVTARPDFDAALLLVAVEGEQVIGTAFGIEYPGEGWVQQLAVRHDRRGLGIAKALLAELFSIFRARGYQSVGLNTDSRTGALDLYVGLGMEVTYTFTHYRRQLDQSD